MFDKFDYHVYCAHALHDIQLCFDHCPKKFRDSHYIETNISDEFEVQKKDKPGFGVIGCDDLLEDD